MADEPGARRLTLAELATEAAAPPELVERLVALGQIVPAADGTFDPRDGLVIRVDDKSDPGFALP